jgi:hypothetical protein
MKSIAIKFILFILTVTLGVSCAPTVKVSTDYDRSANFSSYKTFSIYNLTTSLNVNELNAERIWNSIRSEMIKKGYKENNNNPDLMINVVSLLRDKKYVSATDNGWYRPYWGTRNATIQAYDYKDGSLLIHVVDLKTDRLIWEGKGNAEITKQPKNPDEAIGNAIAKIMSAFPHGNIN